VAEAGVEFCARAEGGMKRWAIFLGLGPLSGLIVLVLENWILYGRTVWDLNLIPYAYLVGLLPAAAAALLDASIDSWRIVLTAIGGYLMTVLVTAAGMYSPFQFEWVPVLTFGLTGGVSAAVCSWLSSEKQIGGKDA
jgi:hypothetical protein